MAPVGSREPYCLLDLVLMEGVVFQILAVPSYGPPFECVSFTWIHCEDSSDVHGVIVITWLCVLIGHFAGFKLDFSSTGECRRSAG